MITKSFVFRIILTVKKYAWTFIKWLFIAIVIGLVGGGVGTLFYKSVAFANELRKEYPFIILFLPLGGVAIAGLYKLCKLKEDPGTNLIISSVRTKDHVPVVIAPLIFVSTVITHLLGGSAGREGAALQLGGSIGAKIGELFKLDERDMSLVIMCGMSGVFSSLFGTPLTAALFAMGVISVGVIYYVGLVPCVVSALVAYKVSLFFGSHSVTYNISDYVPELNTVSFIRTGILAVLCALVSIFFCMAMKYTHFKLKVTFKNNFVRAAVGGCAIIVLTLIIGNQDYNGAGSEVISAALEQGTAHWYSFIMKIIFTAITIGAGFKGGEIVPTMFIGSTFGCAVAPLLGLEPQFGAAVGLIALFCGVVNCPLASIFLSIEMFGSEGLLLFAFACGVSYMLSGYYGLYTSQKIVYSKLSPKYVNKSAH
ncbi:MAG: chloride channel protein [Oscillospiraceae bacterium]